MVGSQFKLLADELNFAASEIGFTHKGKDSMTHELFLEKAALEKKFMAIHQHYKVLAKQMSALDWHFGNQKELGISNEVVSRELGKATNAVHNFVTKILGCTLPDEGEEAEAWRGDNFKPRPRPPLLG